MGTSTKTTHRKTSKTTRGKVTKTTRRPRPKIAKTSTRSALALAVRKVAAAKKRHHILDGYDRLLLFANAPDWALERWPHAFLYPGPLTYDVAALPKRKSDPTAEWDRQEQAMQVLYLGNEWSACGAALKSGDGVRVVGLDASVQVLELQDGRPVVLVGSTRRELQPGQWWVDHPACITNAKAIRASLYWLVGGVVALDPDGPAARPNDPSIAWAAMASRYVVAVDWDLGWTATRAPRSRNRRPWRGSTEGGEPGDATSGEAKKHGEERLAFRLPESRPRRCDCIKRHPYDRGYHHGTRPCGRFFHGRRSTSATCPDCRD